MECAICYKSNKKEKVCKLDCNHSFCDLCIKKWYMKNPSCPMCRTPILNENWDTEFINTIFIEKFNELINEKKINLYAVGELQIAHFFAALENKIDYVRNYEDYVNWYEEMANYAKIEYDKKKEKAVVRYQIYINEYEPPLFDFDLEYKFFKWMYHSFGFPPVKLSETKYPKQPRHKRFGYRSKE